MSILQAKFRQSPDEVLRYILDYSLFLAPTESLVSVTPAIFQNTGMTTPAFDITVPIVISATAPLLSTQASYFASGGVDQGVYEVQFLATTSLGQVLEDVIEYTLLEKV